MKYLSVCSGIEAATVAFQPLGWTPIAFSEIEPFANQVLSCRFPQISNLGDMTKYEEWKIPNFDLLIGGTPCQSFSVAGLKQGLKDPRGNLALVYLSILDKYRPTWCVWENVPGVLQSNGGRDFGAFVGGLGKLGYGWAYRVLDSQYFGVPQRRRRVFLVGHLGDSKRATEVLFDPESIEGPSRKDRQSVRGVDACSKKVYSISPLKNQGARLRASNVEVASGLTVVNLANSSERGIRILEEDGIRRLTPREVERCFGFPDDWTAVGDQPNDRSRYKALGNSMCVNVVRWIGSRIK